MNSGGRKLRELRYEPSWHYCVTRLGVETAWLDVILHNLTVRLTEEAERFSHYVKSRDAWFTFQESPLGDLRVVFGIVPNDESSDPDDEVVSMRWIERADDTLPIGFEDFPR